MNYKILKKIPSVNDILELPEIKELGKSFSHNFVVDSIRKTLNDIRERVSSNDIKDDLFIDCKGEIEVSIPRLTNLVSHSVKRCIPQTHERAINATGVILHTGLGRSPLSEDAIKQIVEISKGYSTLEIDKYTGERGSRYKHIQSIICTLTGASDALLVNNNAAAVLLSLDTLAKGKEVIVSRAEQVEIGGSFRMPDIMAKSGAILVEIGTTNRTYISDYKKAISERTGLILIVHPSNFRIFGFTASPDIKEIAALGREHKIPTLYDLGSGAMIDFKRYNLQSPMPTNPTSIPLSPPLLKGGMGGLKGGHGGFKGGSHGYPQSPIPNLHEPTVKEGVEAGIDIITFSTDKLLGGPQGGLIIGKKRYIDLCKENSLLRALRVDKNTIAALNATLRLYLNEENAIRTIPILKMIYTSIDDIAMRVDDLKNEILRITNDFFTLYVDDGTSEVGGGSCPAMSIPTKLISISSKYISASNLSKELRLNNPPVFGRIERDIVMLDLRTVIGECEEKEILKALRAIADKRNTGKDACATKIIIEN